MASRKRSAKVDAVREAAAEYFAARSHDAWRRAFLKANPGEKGKPRMRMRAGVMVDVNQPWSRLHPKAKADNKIAAYDAYDAVVKFPHDRESAAAYVHERWVARNRKDPNQPKALFKPYARLPEAEKDKDRAHVDQIKKALAAVRRQKTARKVKPVAGGQTVQLDAKTWRRVERAARDLSKAVGREVRPEALLSAAVEAFAVVCKAVADETRAKKA